MIDGKFIKQHIAPLTVSDRHKLVVRLMEIVDQNYEGDVPMTDVFFDYENQYPVNQFLSFLPKSLQTREVMRLTLLGDQMRETYPRMTREQRENVVIQIIKHRKF